MTYFNLGLHICSSIAHLHYYIIQLFIRAAEQNIDDPVLSQPQIQLVAAVKLIHALLIVFPDDRLFSLQSRLEPLLVRLLTVVIFGRVRAF